MFAKMQTNNRVDIVKITSISRVNTIAWCLQTDRTMRPSPFPYRLRIVSLGKFSCTNLCNCIQSVCHKWAVGRCVSRRRGNTGRLRTVVPWRCSTRSQRLALDDLSDTELTAVPSASARYVGTYAQRRYVRPVLSPNSRTALAIHLRQQNMQYNQYNTPTTKRLVIRYTQKRVSTLCCRR